MHNLCGSFGVSVMHKLSLWAFYWFFLFSQSVFSQIEPNTWTEVPMPTPATCAFGDPFAIFVKPGRSDKVVVDFEGGGACWSGVTCEANSVTFTSNISRRSDYFKSSQNWRGIFDIHDPRNPVADATIVHIPYCTGDVHWGNSVQTYKIAGQPPFTIHHSGAVNVSMAIEWMQKNLKVKPETIHVTGCSGGAYGSIYWAPYLKKIFPKTKMLQFGDSGAGVSTPEFRERGLPQWNITAYAPYWIPALDPKNVDWSKLNVRDLYIGVANYYKNDYFSQFNHYNDLIQTYFYSVMGGNPLNWSELMQQSIQSIALATKEAHFDSALVEGTSHCAMTSNLFYDTDVNGKRLYEWFSENDH